MNEIIDRDLLIVLPQPKDALSVFTSEDGSAIEPFLQMVRDKIDAFKGDATTASGRAAIKSMAHKVAKSKTALEEVGKALADEQKSIPKRIDATRKRIKDTLDLWRDEVRKPVDDWETKEDARKLLHTTALTCLDNLASPSPDLTAKTLNQQLSEVQALTTGAEREEYAAEFVIAKERAIEALTAALAKREKYEFDQAELAALRAQQAERERLDREADIRAQAAAEERKRNEAAQQAERDAAAKREADLQAERDAAEQRAKNAAAKAKREIEDQKRAEEAETARREADKAHKRKVNNAALAALIENGIDDASAKEVIKLIASKAIPAVTISY